MRFVITGGASGLGQALVTRLSGHSVWILDINAPEELAQGHQYIETNLSQRDSIDQAIEQLPEEIDGIANVAGIARADNPSTVLAVNFLGLRHITEQLTPRLVSSGRVINVSSIAGRDWQSKYERLQPLLNTRSFNEGLTWCQTHQDMLARDPYTFSKRVVTAYTKRLAQVGLRDGYTVNCISPGPIETPLYPQFESLMGKAQSDWSKAQTGRAASANDIAEVLDALLTRPCNWLNGVDIPVDGGYAAGLESGWIDFAASPVMQARAK